MKKCCFSLSVHNVRAFAVVVFLGRFMVSFSYSSGKMMMMQKDQLFRIVDLTQYFLQSR